MCDNEAGDIFERRDRNFRTYQFGGLYTAVPKDTWQSKNLSTFTRVCDT